MRKAITLALLLLPLPVIASAQPDENQAPPAVEWPEFEDSPADAPVARLGFVFDPVTGAAEAAVEPNTPVEIFLMAWDVQVALHAWEAHLDFDPRLTILESEYFADLHLDQEGDVRAMLQPENCATANQVQLARFKVILLERAADDLVFGLGPCAAPSRITTTDEEVDPSPVYLVCRPGKDIRPFEYSAVSAVLNPVTVHAEPMSGKKPRFETESGRRN